MGGELLPHRIVQDRGRLQAGDRRPGRHGDLRPYQHEQQARVHEREVDRTVAARLRDRGRAGRGVIDPGRRQAALGQLHQRRAQVRPGEALDGRHVRVLGQHPGRGRGQPGVDVHRAAQHPPLVVGGAARADPVSQGPIAGEDQHLRLRWAPAEARRAAEVIQRVGPALRGAGPCRGHDGDDRRRLAAGPVGGGVEQLQRLEGLRLGA